MKRHLATVLTICLGAAICAGVAGDAPTTQQLEQRISTLETQVRSLLRRVETLEKQQLEITKPTTKRKDPLEKIVTESAKRAATPAERKGFGTDLAVGQVAYLDGTHDTGREVYQASAYAREIIDANNMIVEITIGYKAEYPRFSTTGVPSRHIGITKLIWLKGVSTAGLVDNSKVNCPDPMKVTGTKTYTAVTGALRTTFVLEPYRD
ncbi:MAG TPA: hypothetical protein VJJ98_11035 [Sedimentisphaerales bacterium]|nr:hypothetical protein [Sedimentisphaerales bacterium]